MTRIAIIGLLTLLLGQTMQAQENNYQVRGVVADSLTNETGPCLFLSIYAIIFVPRLLYIHSFSLQKQGGSRRWR